MTHTPADPASVSLFSSIQQQYGGRLQVSRFTKTTLTQISQTFEAVVFSHHLTALFLVGLQQVVNRSTETIRYRELLTPTLAQHVFIFSSAPPPTQPHQQITDIELAANDALNDEWFLVINAPQIRMLIAGKAMPIDPDPNFSTYFETFWSFDNHVVRTGLEVLAQKVAHYRPDSLDIFHNTGAGRNASSADVTLDFMTEFLLRATQFQEQILQHLTNSIEIVMESEELLHEVSASIAHTIYVAQVVGRSVAGILFVSPNCEALTGYTQQDFYNDHDLWFKKLIHPQDAEYALTHYNSLRLNQTKQIEYRIVRSDGGIRWVHDSVRSLPARQPNERRIYGVLRDITQDRKLQEDLLRTQQLEQDLITERAINAAKSTLMSTISHEFRTPLAAILSATEMIERYGDRLTISDLRGRAAGIRYQVERMRTMMDDLAEILRAESGKLSYSPRPIEVTEFCQQVIDEVRNLTENKRHFILIQQGVASRAMIDPRLMRHALMNLLLNAVKYSAPDSPITCEVHGKPEHVDIIIKDQGIGIPADDLPHIFEPFHRGRNVENITGTGLGLKIVKDYVELHSAIIAVSSVEGQGTTFTLTLPRV